MIRRVLEHNDGVCAACANTVCYVVFCSRGFDLYAYLAFSTAIAATSHFSVARHEFFSLCEILAVRDWQIAEIS